MCKMDGTERHTNVRPRRAAMVDSLRRSWNMTQGDLGQVMGLSQSAVSRRIRGLVGFSDEEIRRLARYADVEERWFEGA